MEKERFKLTPYVSLVLRKGNDILLLRRYNTGYDDGLFTCASGGVDGNESITQATIRESYEELGIKVEAEDLRVVHVLHIKRVDQKEGNEYLHFFLEASKYEGEPKVMEPNKCDKVDWFAIDALPENIMPSVKDVLKSIEKNIFYSELGW